MGRGQYCRRRAASTSSPRATCRCHVRPRALARLFESSPLAWEWPTRPLGWLEGLCLWPRGRELGRRCLCASPPRSGNLAAVRWAGSDLAHLPLLPMGCVPVRGQWHVEGLVRQTMRGAQGSREASWSSVGISQRMMAGV